MYQGGVACMMGVRHVSRVGVARVKGVYNTCQGGIQHASAGVPHALRGVQTASCQEFGRKMMGHLWFKSSNAMNRRTTGLSLSKHG